MPKLIGIAGPSGAGKSTVTKLIQSQNPDILRVKLDNYFNDIEGFPKNNGEPNWDVPEALNFDLLYKNLLALKAGKEEELPYFDKVTFERIYRKVQPKPIVLVEGFLLYFEERIRNLFDLKIYLDISDQLTLERRLKRQTPERNKYIQEVVIPNYTKYGLPAKQYSDVVLNGSLSTEEVANEINIIIAKTN